MKNLLVLFILILTGVASGETYHTFSDLEGRSVEANILKLNLESGKILLGTRSGKKVWMDPTVFSDSDQEFISTWIKSESFRNPELFKVTINKKEGEWRTTGKINFSSRNRKEKSMRYTIKLDNTSDARMSRLRMEYCTYIEKTTGSKSYIEIKYHSKSIGSMKAKEQKDLLSVNCPSVRGTSSSGGNEEAVGVCFRFYVSIPDGEEVMREVRYPRLLSEKKYPWKGPKPKRKSMF